MPAECQQHALLPLHGFLGVSESSPSPRPCKCRIRNALLGIVQKRSGFFLLGKRCRFFNSFCRMGPFTRCARLCISFGALGATARPTVLSSDRKPIHAAIMNHSSCLLINRLSGAPRSGPLFLSSGVYRVSTSEGNMPEAAGFSPGNGGAASGYDLPAR